jgi:hypothetical protein
VDSTVLAMDHRPIRAVAVFFERFITAGLPPLPTVAVGHDNGGSGPKATVIATQQFPALCYSITSSARASSPSGDCQPDPRSPSQSSPQPPRLPQAHNYAPPGTIFRCLERDGSTWLLELM